MKISKKNILVTLGYLSLTGALVGTTVFASQQNKINKTQTISMSSKDFIDAENILEQNLEALSSSTQNFVDGINAPKLPKEVMDKVKEESRKFLKTNLNKKNVNINKELVDFTKPKNIDLNSELNKYYASEKWPFSKNSTKTISSLLKNDNLKLVEFGGFTRRRRMQDTIFAEKMWGKKKQNTTKKEDKRETLGKYADKLLQLSYKSGGFAAAAAAMAAGYWAAAWFFGLSIPAAVTATAQAGMLAAEAITYRVYYDQLVLMNDWNKLKNTDFTDPGLHKNREKMKEIGKLHASIKLAKTTLTAVETTSKAVKAMIAATSWAAPAAAAMLALLELGFSVAKFVV